MKQLLKVARMGHPVLREECAMIDPASIADPEFQDLIDSMYMTMLEYEGVGLAAPQVHHSLRLVVFHEAAGLEGPDGGPLTALINAQIDVLGDGQGAMWEGCLSIPGLRGKVTRPNHIRLRGLDRNGAEVDLELEDFAAIVTQHECDHLDGVLFIDRLDSTQELAFQEEFDRHMAAEVEDDEDCLEE